jgi:hypothetical protein
VAPGQDCYQLHPGTKDMTDPEQQANQALINTCLQQQDTERRAFDDAKNAYDGNKYAFIAIFNLIILVVAFFWKKDDSIMTGLFLGSVLSTFFSTISYFQTNSKLGFGILVVTFFMALYFITKRKHILFGDVMRK